MNEKQRGSRLAGGNPLRDRPNHDYYATPVGCTEALFRVEDFEGEVWEPACGNGMISEVIKKYNPVSSSDLIDRGYGEVGVDFLKTDMKIDNIVTNPPFCIFQEFAEKSLESTTKKVALFGKIQVLEGQKRSEFLMNSPLKYVYVFKNRVGALRNGQEFDENGKKWQGTMAFAWYVWDKSYKGEPIIRWINTSTAGKGYRDRNPLAR